MPVVSTTPTDRMEGLLTQSKWNEALALVEKVELQNLNPETHPYVVQLALYLILNDLDSAKYFWKRTPSTIKKVNAELSSLWTVGKHMWERDHAATYESVRQFPWTAAIQPLINAIIENFKQRTFRLISKAFSSISVADCCKYFDMTSVQFIAFAKTNGWVVDEATQMVTPKPVVTPVTRHTGLTNINDLTEFVLFLEQP
ncbi:COP9 signalosome complex subunit 8 [Pelomyxa schiedti]|nr:COP9 signalosome complex subunit 8 [Pelomyxa schiedti]